MSRDNRVDSYIARQADFARPILDHIRAAMHAACPEVEETIKWGVPAFNYKGRPLAGMAAFKAHATLGFWNSNDVRGDDAKAGAMGDFGRIASLADLPDDAALAAIIRSGVAFIDSGAKPVKQRAVRPEPEMPDDLVTAMAANPAAQATFDNFPPSARREYLEWITEAKRPETRVKRLTQAVEWMAEGKKRNWKYEAC
jgi:uncharacterized protein YdeI (YjbR/CyaY-like superfamily)